MGPDADSYAAMVARAKALIPELREIGAPFAQTRDIERFLVYPGPLPVDVRHNIKINREQLAIWAAH
jgi:hypothetical protein